MKRERNPDPLEIKYYTPDITRKDVPIARAWAIPQNYTTGALKEILTGIVWGAASRSIVYFPFGLGEEPDFIKDEDLKGLRFESREDRLAQLDIHAMRLKAAPHKILVEQTYPQ